MFDGGRRLARGSAVPILDSEDKESQLIMLTMRNNPRQLNNTASVVDGAGSEDLLRPMIGSWLERGDTWAVWTLAALLISIWFIGRTRRRKIIYEHPLPPRSTIGVWEQLQQFGSVEFHLRSLESTRDQGKILQYNLWPISRDPIYAVNDPKIARKIQENPKSLKPRNLYDVFDGLVGGACFISEEGDRYKHPRKSTLVGISHANMESMLANMNLVMDQWITQNLGKELGDVVDVDIGAEMQKATINSIGKIAFGYDISTDEQGKTLTSIIKIVDEFGLACEMNPLRKSPLGYFLYSAKREATRLVKEIRSFAQTMLEAHKSKSIDDQQKIVTMNELTSSGTNYEQEDLISDMILLFLAGFDTTGYSIGFTLLELAKNQDVQTKLRDELNSASKDPNAGKKRIISSPLLKNVIKETMRLWPVAASGGGRVLSEDMVVTTKDIKGLEQTMILPKGSLVVMNTFAMQRDKDTFNRPDEWLPDRWDNATEDMKAAYMPFLVGRRSCPGQLLAMSELEVFLSRLLMNYQWSLVKETQPEYSITLKIKGTILQAKKVA